MSLDGETWRLDDFRGPLVHLKLALRGKGFRILEWNLEPDLR